MKVIIQVNGKTYDQVYVPKEKWEEFATSLDALLSKYKDLDALRQSHKKS